MEMTKEKKEGSEMGERRFYIAVNDELPIHISESELKRRQAKISKLMSYGAGGCDCDWEVLFNILLHGDGEKREEQPAKSRARYVCHVCYYESSVPCPQHGHLDAKVVAGIQDHPSPTSTRKEWESWCNKFSLMMFNYHVINWEGANELKALLLSMPCVPSDE